MTFPRKVGVLLILVALVATGAELAHIKLPTLRWLFSFDADPNKVGDGWWLANQAWVLGLVMCGGMTAAGLLMIVMGGNFHWNPLTLRKLERFR